MISQLLVKCATLIAVIHAMRYVGRRAGPRASGLLLGLPSSTAVLLVLCGREKGMSAAIEMAEASLLGLIAAVALPLAYARAVRRGWGLPAALASAVAAYAAVASGLGLVHPSGFAERLAIAFGSILAASCLAARIGIPAAARPLVPPSRRWIAAVRTAMPVSYVLVVGIVTGVAGPRWAGLVSTFPSVSTVVLAVTHLEEGAAPAGRIARALPPANLSTAAFLAAFRLACPTLGLTGGTLCGYLAALLDLAALQRISGTKPLRRVVSLAPRLAAPAVRRIVRSWQAVRIDPHLAARIAPRPYGRLRPAPRRRFAPRLEVLPC